MSTYLAVAKLTYLPVSASDEEVCPGNIGALKKGLEALLSEDARDSLRANQLWADGKALLAEESEDESGGAAEGSVGVDDTFGMEMIGGNLCWPMWNY